MSPVLVTALLYRRSKLREALLLEAFSQATARGTNIPHTIFIPRAKKMSASSTTTPGGQSTPKNKATGRKGGSANYTEDELISLMTLIKEILPIAKTEWDTVVYRHGQEWPYGRSKESIKLKFNRLRRQKAPTGNPNIPESVRLAREAHHLIGLKANIGNGEETFDPVKGFIDDEDIEDLEDALTPKASKSSKKTASTSDSTTMVGDVGDDKQEPIVVTATPRKRSYGRLKKEITEQDAVLKDYLQQQDKRDAERDRKADEREAQRVKREDAREQRWLTMAETIATAIAAGNISINNPSKSHGDVN